MSMSTQDLVQIIEGMAEVIAEHKDELTELDMPIGDSDHGINMARGFAAVREQLPALADAEPAALLRKCGMTLVSQVGGSSGPLYGTAFMKAAGVLKGEAEITLEGFARALEAAYEGVCSRGRSTTGEKTMLDAMEPAVASLKASVEAGEDAASALAAAAQAAADGAEATIPMVATKGRASYLGERSRGHKDPGATSFAYLMGAIAARCA